MIGRLDQYVTFAQKGQIKEKDGQPNERWQEQFSEWANVIAVRGSEGHDRGHDVDKAIYKVRVRARDGIHNGMRIKADYGSLEIMSAYPLHGRKDYIEILCKTLPSQA